MTWFDWWDINGIAWCDVHGIWMLILLIYSRADGIWIGYWYDIDLIFVEYCWYTNVILMWYEWYINWILILMGYTWGLVDILIWYEWNIDGICMDYWWIYPFRYKKNMASRELAQRYLKVYGWAIHLEALVFRNMANWIITITHGWRNSSIANCESTGGYMVDCPLPRLITREDGGFKDQKWRYTGDWMDIYIYTYIGYVTNHMFGATIVNWLSLVKMVI